MKNTASTRLSARFTLALCAVAISLGGCVAAPPVQQQMPVATVPAQQVQQPAPVVVQQVPAPYPYYGYPYYYGPGAYAAPWLGFGLGLWLGSGWRGGHRH